jgi:hypothetical protein
MSIHDLNTEEGIDTAKLRLNAIAKKGGSVEIKEVRETRKGKQNRYLHAMFNELAKEIGEPSIESIKHDVKIALGHYETTQMDNKMPKPTANMSVADFAEFTNKFMLWCLDFHGVRLKTPDEFYKDGE